MSHEFFRIFYPPASSDIPAGDWRILKRRGGVYERIGYDELIGHAARLTLSNCPIPASIVLG